VWNSKSGFSVREFQCHHLDFAIAVALIACLMFALSPARNAARVPYPNAKDCPGNSAGAAQAICESVTQR